MPSLYDSLGEHRKHLTDRANAALADNHLAPDELFGIAKQLATCAHEVFQDLDEMTEDQQVAQVGDAAGRFYDDVIRPLDIPWVEEPFEDAIDNALRRLFVDGAQVSLTALMGS